MGATLEELAGQWQAEMDAMTSLYEQAWSRGPADRNGETHAASEQQSRLIAAETAYMAALRESGWRRPTQGEKPPLTCAEALAILERVWCP